MGRRVQMGLVRGDASLPPGTLLGLYVLLLHFLPCVIKRSDTVLQPRPQHTEHPSRVGVVTDRQPAFSLQDPRTLQTQDSTSQRPAFCSHRPKARGARERGRSASVYRDAMESCSKGEEKNVIPTYNVKTNQQTKKAEKTIV